MSLTFPTLRPLYQATGTESNTSLSGHVHNFYIQVCPTILPLLAQINKCCAAFLLISLTPLLPSLPSNRISETTKRTAEHPNGPSATASSTTRNSGETPSDRSGRGATTKMVRWTTSVVLLMRGRFLMRPSRRGGPMGSCGRRATRRTMARVGVGADPAAIDAEGRRMRRTPRSNPTNEVVVVVADGTTPRTSTMLRTSSRTRHPPSPRAARKTVGQEQKRRG